MSSFSCPHLDEESGSCMKLRRACVPGRPGCVLQGNSVFAIPVEERIRHGDEATRPKDDGPEPVQPRHRFRSGPAPGALQ